MINLWFHASQVKKVFRDGEVSDQSFVSRATERSSKVKMEIWPLNLVTWQSLLTWTRAVGVQIGWAWLEWMEGELIEKKNQRLGLYAILSGVLLRKEGEKFPTWRGNQGQKKVLFFNISVETEEIMAYFYAHENDPWEKENLRWTRDGKFMRTKFLVQWEGVESTAPFIHRIWAEYCGCKCKQVGVWGSSLLFSHWNGKQGHQLEGSRRSVGGMTRERKIAEFSRTEEEKMD